MSDYLWAEVWHIDLEIPSYLMQVLARTDGTYELYDPQRQAVVRRSASYAELADDLSEDEYQPVVGPRVYYPAHDPSLQDGASQPVGLRVRGMSILNISDGAVDLEVAADPTSVHVPIHEGRTVFSMLPNEAIDIGRSLIEQGQAVMRRGG